MSQVITKRVRISRRLCSRIDRSTGAPVVVGLPPLVSMFNSMGTAYAAGTTAATAARPIETGSFSGSTATASRSGTGFPRKRVPTIE